MQIRGKLTARDLVDNIASVVEKKKLVVDYPYLFKFGALYDKDNKYSGLRNRPPVELVTTIQTTTGERYLTLSMLDKTILPRSIPPLTLSIKRKASDGDIEALVLDFAFGSQNTNNLVVVKIKGGKVTSIAT